jgi:hypothetical protein
LLLLKLKCHKITHIIVRRKFVTNAKNHELICS